MSAPTYPAEQELGFRLVVEMQSNGDTLRLLGCTRCGSAVPAQAVQVHLQWHARQEGDGT